jgi:hypothetical protein
MVRFDHRRQQGWIRKDKHLDAQRFGRAADRVENRLDGVVREND